MGRLFVQFKTLFGLGVEQKLKPKLWTITQIGSCSIRIQEIPAYRPQLSGRKQEEYILPVHLFKKWKVKVKAKEYSSCFLPESCGRYAGISCILIEQEPILVIAQSFGFGFCSTPIVKASYFSLTSPHISISISNSSTRPYKWCWKAQNSSQSI